MLAKSSLLKGRDYPAVAVLNEHAIAIYGGFRHAYAFKNDGIVFDTEKKTCKKILGGESDLKFYSYCQAQQVGSEHFVTVGEADDNNIHTVLLVAASNGSYYETRSIRNYGSSY